MVFISGDVTNVVYDTNGACQIGRFGGQFVSLSVISM